MSIEEQREELQRILGSHQFRRAQKLQKFLILICDYSFHGKSHEVSEYLIATEAFGKGVDFDPSQDSIVRVQAREARRRLREYYQDEGKNSKLILDIPVGSYVPVFTTSGHHHSPKPAFSLKVAAGIAAVCILFLAAAFLPNGVGKRRLFGESASATISKSNGDLGPPLGNLWNRFINSGVPTVLVLSNPGIPSAVAEGTGRVAEASSGIAKSTPVVDPDEYEYTGAGEAMAVHLITSLFKGRKEKLIIKQSRFLTADDVKHYNLILLGGKIANPWTRRLGEDVLLTEQPTPLGMPFSRNQARYETVYDTKTGQIIRDRAVIALRKNLVTGHWLLFLYGVHSQGTRAAAEASTSEWFLSQLKWPQAATPFPDNFQIFVGVFVNREIPEKIVPVTIHLP